LPASLLSLSDDVILGVLSRLSSWDLVQVSRTCSRLKAIAADRSLAIELNYIGHPQHLRAIKRCIKLIHSKTHSLGFEGFLRQGATQIGECFAYTALATRFGFNSVEVFDLRDTNIGDTEVQCFGRKGAVLQLLVGGERGQKITDRGILSLVSTSGAPAFQSKLEKLVMAGTSVTDKSLDLLARHLATLRHLDVSGSDVTEPGKVQFCERRPDCLLKAELLNGEEREPPHEGSDEEVAESAENCDS